MTRILVTFALSVYNNVANLWPPFNRWAYVPANVVATSLLGAVAIGILDLSASDLGISELSLADAAVGLAIGVAVGSGVFVVAATPRGAHLVADRRVAGLSGAMLAYQMLVRVPFGTALLEEFAFRGVLFASWRDRGVLVATIISSVVFGFWHITPAAIMVRTNAPDASRRTMIRV
ncbi:MAG: CPBP family intramembrane metalloprotease, partial [Actinobacteria bacterium]|nr:CPBP family intramembrane metalloprotease [Actinomycetota bacterium]